MHIIVPFNVSLHQVVVSCLNQLFLSLFHRIQQRCILMFLVEDVMLSLCFQAFRSIPDLYHVAFSQLSQLLFKHCLMVARSHIVFYLFLTPLEFVDYLFVPLFDSLVGVCLSMRHVRKYLSSLLFLIFKHLQ